MQEKTTLILSQPTLQAIRSGQGAHTALYAELQQQQGKLESLLTGYHFTSRERVFNLAVEQDSVKINANGTGNFVVHYSIGMFNACADLDHTGQTRMTVSVAVTNFDTGDTTLTGEYIPEREPDGF